MLSLGRRFHEILLGVAEATDIETLSARVMPPLAAVLSASMAIVHRNRADGVEGGPAPIWTEAMRCYAPYEESCPVRHVKRRTRKRVAVVTDLLDTCERRSPVFAECFGPLDADRQMIANLGDVPFDDTGATMLILTRSRRQAPWAPADVAAVRSFLPALSAAIARNDRWAAVTAVAGSAAPQLAFDSGGRMQWMSSSAAHLLDGDVLERLAAAARALGTSERPSPLIVRLGGRGGHGALLRRERGPNGVPLVIACLELPHARSVVSAAAQFGLTRAETEVLDALARGYSNAEIGDYLGITRGTVRIHLSRIYGKLAVSSRTQALAKLNDTRAPWP
jgi:DNA-binding CsgD family transcriptional regulator